MMKKILCIVLTLFSLVSLLGVSVFADGEESNTQENVYTEAIEYCVEKGYVTEDTRALLEGDTELTRSTFIIILAAHSGDDLSEYTQSGFFDVTKEKECLSAVAWAKDKEIIDSADMGGKFRPDELISADELFAMLEGYTAYKDNSVKLDRELTDAYYSDSKLTCGELASMFMEYDELFVKKNEPSGGGYQIKEPTILSSAKKKGGAAGKRTATFGTVTKSLLDGFLTTVELFGLTLLFSLPIGLICSFASMSKAKPVKWFMKTFIWIIRGTPLMLQLIVVYYGPGLVGTWAARTLTDLMTTGSPFITKLYELWPWLGLNFAELVINLLEWLSTWTTFDRFFAALLAFVINYSCYFSEIFRGGIESISKGQYEAGQVLGMTKIQVFFKVVLLQVVKRIIAPMSNEIMTLVKDTSLARTIAVYEVIWAGQRFIKSDGLLWPLFYTAVFYLIFCGLLTILFGKLEKKLDYFN